MIDYPALIFLISAAVIGATIYMIVFWRNERRRDEVSEGHVCGRCRQLFDQSLLSQIWQFPVLPLRILGWNEAPPAENPDGEEVGELDALYCPRCRRIINFYLIASLVISVPIMFSFVYLVMDYIQQLLA